MVHGALSVGAKGAVGSSFNFAPALYQSLIKAFEEGDDGNGEGIASGSPCR